MVREDRKWVLESVLVVSIFLFRYWKIRECTRDSIRKLLICGLECPQGELLVIQESWKKSFFADSSDTRRRIHCERGETLAQ